MHRGSFDQAYNTVTDNDPRLANDSMTRNQKPGLELIW